MELYQILLTRSNAYINFMHCLKAHQQTGAYDILLEGFHDKSIVPELAKQLISVPVEISGVTMDLKGMFPDFSLDDAKQILYSEEFSLSFVSFIGGTTAVLKLDECVPKPQSFYISRYVCNMRLLDPKIFQMDCQDVFVFKNVGINELKDVLGNQVCRQSTSQRSYITCRHIHLDDDEDWEDMVLVSKGPMHLVHKESVGYILQKSTQVTEVVLMNSSDLQDHKHMYIPEEELVDYIISDDKCRGILLADHPGMGKTYLMESIALKIQNRCRTDKLVICVSLPELSIYLGQQLLNEHNRNVLKSILGYAYQKNQFAALLVEILIQRKLIRMILVLDGFDEVSENLKEPTIKLLATLGNLREVLLILSTRPCERKTLEKAFHLISFDILPYNENEQVVAITTQWNSMYPNGNRTIMQNLAHQCIQCLNQMQTDDGRDILGIPLKCYIVAIVNEPFVEQLSRINRTRPIQIRNGGIIASASNLYEKFVERSISRKQIAGDEKQIFGDEKQISGDEKQNMLNFFELKALELFFPEIADMYASRTNLNPSSPVYCSTKTVVLQSGILGNFSSEKFVFLHRTFAEFFAGRFFAHFWKNVVEMDRQFVTVVGTYFIENLLSVQEDEVALDEIRIKFNKIGFSGINKNTKIGRFTYNPVLWFMNSILGTSHINSHLKSSVEHFKKCLLPASFSELLWKTIAVWQGNPNYALSVNSSLTAHTFLAILACTEERYTPVCSLISHFVGVIFETKDAEKILNHQHNTKSLQAQKAGQALILVKQALSRSVETSHQLIREWKNSPFLKFCNEFPEEYYSPLEAAIDINDIEMVDMFLNIVHLPWDRLLLRCLMSTSITETNLSSRLTILQKILDLDNTRKFKLSIDAIKEYVISLKFDENYNLELLKKFALRNGFTLYNLPRCCKLILLENTLLNGDDNDVIETIKLVYTKQVITAPTYTNEYSNAQITNAISSELNPATVEGVINQLDLSETKKTLLKLQSEDTLPFDKVHSVETLKVLIAVWPDFSRCNSLKFNYLHFAVQQDKLGWVKFLLDSGHDVNQRNVRGLTPLQVISGKHSLELTRLLMAAGADVSSVDTAIATLSQEL